MALTAPRRRIPTGSAAPRLAPPLPVTSLRRELVDIAAKVGIDLWPWQRDHAARYLMARHGERWLFREVAIVVARQNGKTELLVPRILWALQQGRKVIHTAQNRTLPREVYDRVAYAVDDRDLGLGIELKKRIRYANGQEKITARNGGSYQIVAPQRGARGLTADDLIIDELREFEDYDFIGAATPTLTSSPDPQVIYLSNAGHDRSVVLNDLRENGSSDWLAYVEWSADPDLDASDWTGWAQANPALGHKPGMWENLQHAFTSRPPNMWETEHLCRWVPSDSASVVTDLAWRQCAAEALEPPSKSYVGISLDPSGRRASAVLAWQQPDGSVALRSLLEVDDPAAVDVDDFGAQLRNVTRRIRVRGWAYSGVSDVAVARYLVRPAAIDGRLYANASARFASLVESRKLRWADAQPVTDDLRYAIRKDHTAGAWSAVRSEENRPITAALAAIRAVWLASEPKPAPPRIG